jgi:hypothetical protein
MLATWIKFVHFIQVIHIWQYDHYPGYVETRSRLSSDEKYNDFQRKLRKTVYSRQNQILLEFASWKNAELIEPGGIYELRTYQLKPGRLLEWEHEWKKGLEARRKFVQPVGAWFTQLGPLNRVHHMWSYRYLLLM